MVPEIGGGGSRDGGGGERQPGNGWQRVVVGKLEGWRILERKRERKRNEREKVCVTSKY